MASNFLHDKDGITGITTTLSSTLDTYSDNVEKLERLINEMTSSNDWKDENVKTAYIQATKGYIKAYKSYIKGIEKYIKCLKTKSKDFSECEDAFSA